MSRHAEFTSTSNKRKVILIGGGETDGMEKSKKRWTLLRFLHARYLVEMTWTVMLC